MTMLLPPSLTWLFSLNTEGLSSAAVWYFTSQASPVAGDNLFSHPPHKDALEATPFASAWLFIQSYRKP